MKFKIVRSKFLEGLKKVQNIVGTKGSMLIIQNVLIEAKDRTFVGRMTSFCASSGSSISCSTSARRPCCSSPRLTA